MHIWWSQKRRRLSLFSYINLSECVSKQFSNRAVHISSPNSQYNYGYIVERAQCATSLWSPAGAIIAHVWLKALGGPKNGCLGHIYSILIWFSATPFAMHKRTNMYSAELYICLHGLFTRRHIYIYNLNTSHVGLGYERSETHMAMPSDVVGRNVHKIRSNKLASVVCEFGFIAHQHSIYMLGRVISVTELQWTLLAGNMIFN